MNLYDGGLDGRKQSRGIDCTYAPGTVFYASVLYEASKLCIIYYGVWP